MSYHNNDATFKACQARYDSMQHPDYYAPDAPPCHICGYDADMLDEDDMPICEECQEEWYTCPSCGEEFDHRSSEKNQLCEDCRKELN